MRQKILQQTFAHLNSDSSYVERSLEPYIPGSKMTKLKLIYFDIKGRAEAIRLAFKIANIDFEDVRVTSEEFLALKPKLPFGQLPVLEIDEDKYLAQSVAILLYVGELSGSLLPDNPLEKAKVNEILFGLEDLYHDVLVSIHEKDAEKKIIMRQKLSSETIPNMLERINNVLVAGGTEGYAVGNKRTVADIAIHVMLSWICQSGVLDGIPTDLANKHSRILSIIDSVAAEPKVKEWNASQTKK